MLFNRLHPDWRKHNITCPQTFSAFLNDFRSAGIHQWHLKQLFTTREPAPTRSEFGRELVHSITPELLQLLNSDSPLLTPEFRLLAQ